MAIFDVSGLDDLLLSLSEIAQIPDAVKDNILTAQAAIVITAQKKKAREYGVEDSGITIRSICRGEIKNGKDGKYVSVYSSGTRKRGKQTIRNPEIAFINEYGTRRQKARPFIRSANASCENAVTQAAHTRYDEFLKSKNL